MTNPLRDLKTSRNGKRALRDRASPLYRWLRTNMAEVSELRESGVATWKDILGAARLSGLNVEVSQRMANVISKQWYRLQNEAQGLPVDAKSDASAARPEKILPPSKVDPDWRPDEVEAHWADREELVSVRPTERSSPDETTEVALVPAHPIQAPPVAIEDNEKIPKHSRDSLKRLREKIRARKEEKYRLTPD
ncbi:hypothetical protein [Gluconobacter cerinus]|uniref:Uncharacterized protein n=1 Tax=Gluconobacter cerinus TaxID=38307 RepID=A0AAV5NIE9_9PROT|nr:hypothetical protein [Gluconobacter cerinus]GLQ64212.1 hypothetical protein GCM10007867_30590 [Gluconobacter cerinus]